MVTKLDEREIFTGSTIPMALAKKICDTYMLTRDQFAVSTTSLACRKPKLQGHVIKYKFALVLAQKSFILHNFSQRTATVKADTW